MAWQGLGDKPLSEPMMAYCKLDFWEQISETLNGNIIIFIQENAFEMSSAKMADILSRGRRVNIVHMK